MAVRVLELGVVLAMQVWAETRRAAYLTVLCACGYALGLCGAWAAGATVALGFGIDRAPDRMGLFGAQC